MTGLAVGPPDGGHPHVVVADLGSPSLDDETAHHLGRVRRLRDGDACTATDLAGRWRWCRFRTDGTLEPDGEVTEVRRPEPPITIAFALTKGDKPDLVVQKLTELGVDRIVPFRAERSVVRWDPAKAAVQAERLQAIARGAVAQSRRCWPTVVEPVADVATLAARGAVRMERGHGPLDLARNVLAIGPEGGWSDAERELLADAAGLGPNVLRAETAALTSGALMVSLRSGIVGQRGQNFDGG